MLEILPACRRPVSVSCRGTAARQSAVEGPSGPLTVDSAEEGSGSSLDQSTASTVPSANSSFSCSSSSSCGRVQPMDGSSRSNDQRGFL